MNKRCPFPVDWSPFRVRTWIVKTDGRMLLAVEDVTDHVPYLFADAEAIQGLYDWLTGEDDHWPVRLNGRTFLTLLGRAEHNLAKPPTKQIENEHLVSVLGRTFDRRRVRFVTSRMPWDGPMLVSTIGAGLMLRLKAGVAAGLVAPIKDPEIPGPTIVPAPRQRVGT